MIKLVYDSIVVGTDGSPSAKRAVAQGARLAVALDCTLHVVSAYEPLRGARIVGAPEGAAQIWKVRPDAQVEAITSEAGAFARNLGVKVQMHALTGDPAEALLEIAELEQADLIVVGNRGMHGVGRVIGSVPSKVSHRAGCDVLIVTTDAD